MSRLIGFSVLWLLLWLSFQPLAIANTTPLLMEGKKTLYQRVLTRPGASVYTNAGDKAGVKKPAFTRYYVYQRKEHLKKQWLQVGPDSRGKVIGWITEGSTSPWKQQLSLAFTHPAGRERVLFFKDSKDLEAVLTATKPADEIAPIRKKIIAGNKDPKIISIEPEKPVDINKNFYLLPILDWKEIYTEMGEANMLEVASVSLQDESKKKDVVSAKKTDSTILLKRFKAAVVFVIDSTISMGPYIERTREAVKRIYGQIEKAQLLDKVKFGLVAYRSSIDAVPGLEYTSKKYVDPVEVKDGDDFLKKVSGLKAATVSSRLFNEDTYAGVMDALNNVKWTEFGARYIILITDAGAIEGNDKLSSTGFGAKQVREEAKYRGVAVYSLHLKTASGKKANNHDKAAAQYKELSSVPSFNKSLYYPIDMGSVDEFSTIVDRLSDSVVNLVNDAYQGKTVAGSAKTADAKFGIPNAKPEKSVADKISEDMALMGHAMQLSYLGRETGVKAPPLFKAWISDRAIESPTKVATEVRVLLTKNQLSEMYKVVGSVVDSAINSKIQPDDFFRDLRSIAVKLGRDPNQINQSQDAKLSELGLMDEYLSDLPYKSLISGLSKDSWKQMGEQKQNVIIRELKRKVKHYELYNNDTDRWIPLAENSDPGDYVYPVPIEMMP